MLFYAFLLKVSFSSEHRFNVKDNLTVFFANICPKDMKKECIPIKQINYFKNLPEQSLFKINTIERLGGYNKIDSTIRLPFQEKDKVVKTYSNTFTKKDVDMLSYFINSNYQYQLFADDLYTTAPIGNKYSNKVELFSLFAFVISTNGNNVIDVRVTTKEKKELKPNEKFEISYTYKFVNTSVTFENRMNKFHDTQFFESKLHDYSSSLNTIQCLIYILLAISICKRLLSDIDMQRKRLQNSHEFDEFDPLTNNPEKGWRSLHADVFRAPQKANMLSFVAGIGIFFAAGLSIYSLIISCFTSKFNSQFAFYFSFIIASFLCGIAIPAYRNSFKLKNNQNQSFIPQIPILFVFACYFLISILFHGRTNHSLPIHLIIVIFGLLSVLSFAFCYFGSYVCQKMQIQSQNPNEVAIVPKRMPNLPWFFSSYFLTAFGSVLISSSIMPEFYYIQYAIWKGKYYYTFLYFCVSIITTLFCSGFFSITITYFRLQNECYTWHWLSFIAPASCGVVLFLYSIVFDYMNLPGISFVTRALYYIWSFCASSAIGIACGGSGFFITNIFVRMIFFNLKID